MKQYSCKEPNWEIVEVLEPIVIERIGRIIKWSIELELMYLKEKAQWNGQENRISGISMDQVCILMAIDSSDNILLKL